MIDLFSLSRAQRGIIGGTARAVPSAADVAVPPLSPRFARGKVEIK